jgi:DNA polymerase-1
VCVLVLCLHSGSSPATLPIRLRPLGIKYFVAYHPAYVSRTPAQMPVWEQQLLKATRAALGIIARPMASRSGDVPGWVDGSPDLSSPWLAADTETDDLTEGVGVTRVCWSISDGVAQEFRDDEPPALDHVWLHNAKYDIPLLNIDPWDLSRYDDTMIVAYLLRKYPLVGLKEIGPQITGIPMHSITELLGKGKDKKSFSQALADEPEKARDYAMRDALVTSRQAPSLWAELEAEPNLMWLYENLEKPLVPVLLEMEQRGVQVNPVTLKEMEAELDVEILQLETSLRERLNLPLYYTGVRVIKEHDPLSSPQKLGPAMIEAGVPLRKKTRKSGQLQTDEATLLAACRVDRVEELREGVTAHEIVRDVLTLRGYKKLRSTYLLPLHDKRDRQGRVHGRFNQCVAATGRLSSSDPNLQNIPIRTELGKRIRRVFEAKPGHVHVKGDYSQLEVRLYAHFTKEPVLLDAYLHEDHDTDGPGGKCLRCDVHQGVANTVEIPRKDAKNTLFAALYGASEPKIATTAGVPRNRAGAFLSGLRTRMPSLLNWRQRVLNMITRNGGYVETILKRREYFPEILSPLPRIAEEALRQAANHPIQGSASDIVKILMNRSARELAPQYDAGMVLMVHDELVFEVPEDNALDFGRRLAALGADVGRQVHLSVPLEFSVEIGYNWGDTVPLEEWSQKHEALTSAAG